jgi:hypothetical protein
VKQYKMKKRFGEEVDLGRDASQDDTAGSQCTNFRFRVYFGFLR